MAAVFMAAAFTVAVSVAEALVTGTFEATDFGLVGFRRLLSRLLWQLLPGHYGYGPCYLTVFGTTYCY